MPNTNKDKDFLDKVEKILKELREGKRRIKRFGNKAVFISITERNPLWMEITPKTITVGSPQGENKREKNDV